MTMVAKCSSCHRVPPPSQRDDFGYDFISHEVDRDFALFVHSMQYDSIIAFLPCLCPLACLTVLWQHHCCLPAALRLVFGIVPPPDSVYFFEETKSEFDRTFEAVCLLFLVF